MNPVKPRIIEFDLELPISKAKKILAQIPNLDLMPLKKKTRLLKAEFDSSTSPRYRLKSNESLKRFPSARMISRFSVLTLTNAKDSIVTTENKDVSEIGGLWQKKDPINENILHTSKSSSNLKLSKQRLVNNSGSALPKLKSSKIQNSFYEYEKWGKSIPQSVIEKYGGYSDRKLTEEDLNLNTAKYYHYPTGRESKDKKILTTKETVLQKHVNDLGFTNLIQVRLKMEDLDKNMSIKDRYLAKKIVEEFHSNQTDRDSSIIERIAEIKQKKKIPSVLKGFSFKLASMNFDNGKSKIISDNNNKMDLANIQEEELRNLKKSDLYNQLLQKTSFEQESFLQSINKFKESWIEKHKVI